MGPEQCADKCMAGFDSGGGTVFIPGYMKLLAAFPRGLTDTFVASHEKKLLDTVLAAAAAKL